MTLRDPDDPSGPARAWVLNLDAEHELEGGRRYAPTRRLVSIVAEQSRALLGSLVAPGDLVVDEASLTLGDGQPARGFAGLAWSPTPRARALLERAGATLPPSPPTEVLAAVNARPFAARVRATLDPTSDRSFAKHVALNLDQVLERLARPAADGWLVRRTFGAAGRGRRRIACGAPTEPERAWIAASLQRGPLVIEPWVHITREYTRSGWVARDGRVVVAKPCFQQTTEHGAWTRTARAGSPGSAELERDVDRQLEAAAAAAGAALVEAGYHGPFGIDAFSHRPIGRVGPISPISPGRAREVLNPLSEINARFTMDWTTGMASEAGDRDALRMLDSLSPRG